MYLCLYITTIFQILIEWNIHISFSPTSIFLQKVGLGNYRIKLKSYIYRAALLCSINNVVLVNFKKLFSKADIKLFADFCGMHTQTTVNFKQLMWHCWTWSEGEMHIIGSRKAVWSGSSIHSLLSWGHHEYTHRRKYTNLY